MWDEILKLAVGSGLWAVLFCALLTHVIRDSKKREDKYIETIAALHDKLNIVNEIKENTEKIIKQTTKKHTAAAYAARTEAPPCSNATAS